MEKKDKTIEELIQAFSTMKIPNKTIQLDCATLVNNPSKMISTHIEVLNNNRKNRTYKPYYDRLVQLYNALQNT